MIGRAGVGVDNVDVEAATRRGIVVANAPESTVISAAEHTIGLLLALSRHIPQAHAALKEGRWERSRYGGLELAGKTLGVLGLRPDRPAGRATGARARDARRRLRPVRREGAVPRARRRAGRDAGRRARGGRLPDAAPAADRRDARLDQRGRLHEDARRRPPRERGPRRAPRRGGSPRSARVGQGRRRRARRLRRRAVLGPAARARQRRRHAASRGLDRGGTGPGRRDRRRAGRRGARGRARHERGQHPVDRRGGPRDPRAVHPARCEPRAAGDGARPAGGPSESSSPTTALSPATTRGC